MFFNFLLIEMNAITEESERHDVEHDDREKVYFILIIDLHNSTQFT